MINFQRKCKQPFVLSAQLAYPCWLHLHIYLMYTNSNIHINARAHTSVRHGNDYLLGNSLPAFHIQCPIILRTNFILLASLISQTQSSFVPSLSLSLRICITFYPSQCYDLKCVQRKGFIFNVKYTPHTDKIEIYLKSRCCTLSAFHIAMKYSKVDCPLFSVCTSVC